MQVSSKFNFSVLKQKNFLVEDKMGGNKLRTPFRSGKQHRTSTEHKNYVQFISPCLLWTKKCVKQSFIKIWKSKEAGTFPSSCHKGINRVLWFYGPSEPAE